MRPRVFFFILFTRGRERERGGGEQKNPYGSPCESNAPRQILPRIRKSSPLALLHLNFKNLKETGGGEEGRGAILLCAIAVLDLGKKKLELV